MLALSHLAVEIVVDKSYMKIWHRLWYSNVTKSAPCTVWQVETNVVVPILEVARQYVVNFEEFSTNILAKAQQYLDPKVEFKQTQILVGSCYITVPKVRHFIRKILGT